MTFPVMVEKEIRTTNSRNAHSTAATAKSFMLYLLSVVLAASICCPAMAFADYEDDPAAARTTFDYSPSDFDSSDGHPYGAGTFWSNSSGRYVNSYGEYYIDFNNSEKQKALAKYTPNTSYEMAAVTFQSLAIAATFGGPVGDALALGFTFISDGIKSQEQAVIEAYGEDYAFTDWLIEIFEDQKASKLMVDRSFTIVSDYTAKITYASQETIKKYDEENGKGSWASDKIGLKKGEYGHRTQTERVAKAAGAGLKTPLSDMRDVMYPNSKGGDLDAIITDALNTAAGEDFIEHSAVKKTKLSPEGKDTLFRDYNEKGYIIVQHCLTDEEIAMIQQLIYYLCSSRDWRMMIAEARNVGKDISRADFYNSIQYFMGMDLSPFFDIAHARGVVNLGHWLSPMDPYAPRYALDYLSRNFNSVFKGNAEYSALSGPEKKAYLEALAKQLEENGDPDTAAEIWKLIRDNDEKILNDAAGGNYVIAKALQVAAGKYGQDYVASTILPSVGSKLVRSSNDNLVRLGRTMASSDQAAAVAFNSGVVNNLVRGAAAADLGAYVALHDNMVAAADARHQATMAYAASQTGGKGSNIRPSNPGSLHQGTNQDLSKWSQVTASDDANAALPPHMQVGGTTAVTPTL